MHQLQELRVAVDDPADGDLLAALGDAELVVLLVVEQFERLIQQHLLPPGDEAGDGEDVLRDEHAVGQVVDQQPDQQAGDGAGQDDAGEYLRGIIRPGGVHGLREDITGHPREDGEQDQRQDEERARDAALPAADGLRGVL